MKRTLIGITSFGGLPFLELGLRSLQETITTPGVDICVVVAKPGDVEMCQFLDQRGFAYIRHDQNMGFPESVNDLYDRAFVDGSYDFLIIMGNDVVVMPEAIDTLIRHATNDTEFDIFCASEFNSRFLYDTYPEARQYFDEPNLIFNDFTARPWELHKDVREDTIQVDALKDVRNLTLFTRRSFEIVGYDDINYWPNGYWADNTYARRCNLLGIRAAGLPRASFYHAWSRTIHQGVNRKHHIYFERNTDFYEAQWGSRTWGQETYTMPFNGQPYNLGDITIQPTLEIADREQEAAIIRYWSGLR